ncbi:Spy/CpxP family protein refolding chaperone [Skermanella pratensis]|uniref:Spy/CpxP family protein refolding chaperone n=1 Tax=Skermanella pratensis TaxID=2233999 RepID=UPI0017883E2D|nr:Spy/CpxP family protein refolding chaperone [Skermanella pratensis]
MKTLTRMTLPVLALLASAAFAQAQPQSPMQAPMQSRADDHQAHHPAGQTAQAQPDAAPMQQPGAGMGMRGMGGQQGMPMQGMPMGGGQGGMMMDCPMMRSGQGGASAGMPMMQGMGQGMMGNMGQGGMGMPFEHAEGRIAFLKAEIGITDAQQNAWNAFADAMRRNAETHRAMHRQMMSAEAAAASDWQERLDRRTRMMTARAEAMTALNAAAGPLFSALSEDQRQKAERLLSGPMGMM